MQKDKERNLLPFDRPGNYCIRVLGFLDQSWSERLGGMSITTEKRGDQQPVTKLSGLMVDQAALAGVLNTLYEMHKTLLSVECLNDD